MMTRWRQDEVLPVLCPCQSKELGPHVIRVLLRLAMADPHQQQKKRQMEEEEE